jgi:hypothetical protein
VQKKARNPGPFFDTRETTQAPAPFLERRSPQKRKKKVKKKKKNRDAKRDAKK